MQETNTPCRMIRQLGHGGMVDTDAHVWFSVLARSVSVGVTCLRAWKTFHRVLVSASKHASTRNDGLRQSSFYRHITEPWNPALSAVNVVPDS